MPKVGGKHFPYTKAGEKAAKKESKATGMPMKRMPKGHGPMGGYGG